VVFPCFAENLLFSKKKKRTKKQVSEHFVFNKRQKKKSQTSDSNPFSLKKLWKTARGFWKAYKT
jgi:hypothetical protein